MVTRMSELTEEEKARLPYMTNELYDKNHSVIAKHFPIKQDVGRRLVDSGLLATAEYLEISGYPENAAGSHLICSLTRKGGDSMKTFYKVLLSARGERDVDVVLHSLEAAADLERRSKETTGDRDSMSHLPSTELLPRGPLNARVVAIELQSVNKRIDEIRQDILEVKEAQTRMEQQVLTAIGNVDTQLHCIMRSLPTAQWRRPSELGSRESVYQTAPSSRTNSKGDQDMDGRIRSHTHPPSTLLMHIDSKLPPVDRPTSPILRECKLDHVPEENTDLELDTQPSTEGGAVTSDTNNPAELVDPLPVKETQKLPDKTPPQTMKQRRKSSPLKGTFRSLLCTNGGDYRL